MRPHISIRGCVRPSVGPSVRNAFVKIAVNGVIQDEGASRAVYPALLSDFFKFWVAKRYLILIFFNYTLNASKSIFM